MQANPETLTTLHSTGTKRLLTSWLLVFRHEERETHNFYNADCSYIILQSNPSWTARPRVKILTHWPNKCAAHPVSSSWTGLALSQISTPFFKNYQNSQPIASVHDIIHIPILISYLGFYHDICDCHILCARAWTVLNVCTCTYTKPNSSKSHQTEW